MTGAYNTARKLAATAALLATLGGAAMAATISQGFSASEKFVPGTIVSVQSATAVSAADSEHADGLIGVVVDSDSSTVEVKSDTSTVQVVTTGVVNAFVSDLNGPIKASDQITASPIKGVGMKATSRGKIIGVAQSNFDTSAGKSVTVKTKDGKFQSVRVGQIPIAVQASYYAPGTGGDIVPSAIQSLANTVGQKNVSVVRVLAAASFIFISLIVISVIVFSAIRSAIISIGRNPLAQADIYRSLLQVLLACLTILGVAVAAAYLMVRL